MSTGMQTTLAETVYEVVSGDDGRQAAVEGCEREPASWKGGLSLRESDLRAWGFVYGLAFATARAEEPGSDEAAIAEKALDAARAAYRRWDDEVTPRPEYSPMVDAVLLAFEDCELELDRMRYVDGQMHFQPLVEGLNRLREAIGSPSNGTGL